MSATDVKPTDLTQRSVPPPETPASTWRTVFQSTLFWVGLAFLVSFAVLFLRPVFLNNYDLKLYPNFPKMTPIGADLREYLTFSRALVTQGTPYIGQNYYPPFEAIFFLPWINLPPTQAYNLFTTLNFILFVLVTLLFPLLLGRKKQVNSLVTLIFVTGLFSYGLWFQLERGQYDLIVMLLCFGSLWLFHRRPRWRWLAYMLIIVAIQIKIYPAIFLITFVDDWKDWKANLRRWGLLLLANAAALFVLGPAVFSQFIGRLLRQMGHPTFVTVVNHSINSFVTVYMNQLKDRFPWLPAYSGLIQASLLALFAIFFLLIWFQVYRRNLSGLNPYLILACTIGAMVIPSTSHDYKFAIFVAPVLLFFNALDLRAVPLSRSSLWSWIFQAGLVFLIALAYCVSLYVPDQKPLFLRSNFPPLMVILIASAALMLLRARWLDRSTQPDAFPDF